tara:strand:+ start:4644 stop:4787 length:144 start_codon:yes stop_codon:yes gene_type:complete
MLKLIISEWGCAEKRLIDLFGLFHIKRKNKYDGYSLRLLILKTHNIS